MAITNIKLKPINALIFASIFLLTACGGSGSSSNEGPSPTPTPTPTPIPTDLKDAVTQEYDISIGDSLIFSLPNAQSVALFDGTSGNLYALENTQDPQIQVDVVGTNDEKAITSKSGNYRYEVNPFELKLPYEAKFKIIDKEGHEKISSLTIDLKDTLLPLQWHIYNNGENYLKNPLPHYKGVDGNVYEAWKLKDKEGNPISGKGVVVGVVDSPIDFLHEEFKDKAFTPKVDHPYLNMQLDLSDEIEDHGQSCAGIIGASHNDQGTSGIAYNSKLISISDEALGEDSSIKDIFKYVGDTISENPEIKVLNVSLGTNTTIEEDDESKPFDIIYKNNTTLLHSIGNEFDEDEIFQGTGVLARGYGYDNQAFCYEYKVNCQFSQTDMLARFPFNIHVGALDSFGKKTSYSSIGSNNWIMGFGGDDIKDEEGNEINTDNIVTTLTHFSCAEMKIDTTPGKDIFRDNFDPLCKYTAGFGGTSAAAPTLTGAVALMMQANPNLTVDKVRYVLAKTARNDVNSTNDRHNWNTFSYDKVSVPLYGDESNTILIDDGWQNNQANMRFSNYYGFGVVDTAKAVKMVLDEEAKPTNEQDKFYAKRANHPTIITQKDPNNIECSKSLDSTDALNVYTCVIHGLDPSSETESEIDVAQIDIKGFAFSDEQNGKEDFCKLPENPSKAIDDVITPFKELRTQNLDDADPIMVEARYKVYEGLKNFYKANTKTQIELKAPSGTRSIIKNYYSYFLNVFSDEEFEKIDNLFVHSNAFYLENIKNNGDWEVTIKSYCNVDLDKFKEHLVLQVGAYPVNK